MEIKGKRICVLEDDDDIREIINVLLKEEKYQVSGFASVSDFIRGGKGGGPDLFLLDVMLPDGNGVDVCSMLKSDNLTQNIPVLMMSANSSELEVANSCKAHGFVAKPFDIYDLISKVAKVLE